MESESVVSKKDTKISILEKLGAPNAMSPDRRTWYYVYIKKEFVAFLNGSIKEDVMLKLSFDGNGTLIQKELDNNLLKKQDMLRDITPIERSKKKDNYISEILGNIGNIKQSDDKS